MRNELFIAATEADRNAERLARWIAKGGPEKATAARAERETYRRDSHERAQIERDLPLYAARVDRVFEALRRRQKAARSIA